jgi:hypothetical protein
MGGQFSEDRPAPRHIDYLTESPDVIEDVIKWVERLHRELLDKEIRKIGEIPRMGTIEDMEMQLAQAQKIKAISISSILQD